MLASASEPGLHLLGAPEVSPAEKTLTQTEGVFNSAFVFAHPWLVTLLDVLSSALD